MPGRRIGRLAIYRTLPLLQFSSQRCNLPLLLLPHPPTPLLCSYTLLRQTSPVQVQVTPVRRTGRLPVHRTLPLQQLSSQRPNQSTTTFLPPLITLVAQLQWAATSASRMGTQTQSEIHWQTRDPTTHLWTSSTLSVIPPNIISSHQSLTHHHVPAPNSVRDSLLDQKPHQPSEVQVGTQTVLKLLPLSQNPPPHYNNTPSPIHTMSQPTTLVKISVQSQLPQARKPERKQNQGIK